jgi:hypothetical protein
MSSDVWKDRSPTVSGIKSTPGKKSSRSRCNYTLKMEAYFAPKLQCPSAKLSGGYNPEDF